MAHITVQFNAFHSFWGDLIAWGTQGEVGHASIVTLSGELLDAQHENDLGGQPSGVWVRPREYIRESKGFNILRVRLPATVAQRDAFYAFAYAQVGKPYDTKGILGFMAGKPWHDDGAWFCSELVAAALQHAGIFPRPLHVHRNRVTPQELLLVCSTFGDVEHV